MNHDNLDSSLKLNFHEDDYQPPRPKTKLRFIIIVISLTLAFTIWKSHLKNPSIAIQTACSRTFNPPLCFKSISSLHKNSSIFPSKSTITPSNIFTLSLQAGINELSDQIIPTINQELITETNRWLARPLRKCDNLLNDSQKMLNASLAMIIRAHNNFPNEEIFRDANFTMHMEKNITDARDNIAWCRGELHYRDDVLDKKMEEAWLYVDNSLRIFYYRDEIDEELNPTIASLWNFLFVNGSPYMVLGSLPFVYFIFLVVSFLRAS